MAKSLYWVSIEVLRIECQVVEGKNRREGWTSPVGFWTVFTDYYSLVLTPNVFLSLLPAQPLLHVSVQLSVSVLVRKRPRGDVIGATV